MDAEVEAPLDELEAWAMDGEEDLGNAVFSNDDGCTNCQGSSCRN